MNRSSSPSLSPGLRARSALVCVAAASVLVVGLATAAPIVWTGNGSGGLWSDPASWSLARPPVDGDAVVFAGRPTALLSVVDLSLRLDSLSFAADAGAFDLHVAGSGDRSLTFIGAGIENLTSGSGPIRQSLFADAGSTGGSIVFAGRSGINLGASPSYRPVDLTAVGASAAAAVGGRIVFQDDSSTGLATFNALRATGAATAGAGAGQIVFRDNATVGKFTTVTMAGGGAAGAAGGQGSFGDGVRVDGIVNLLASSVGGQGGRAVFSGNAVAGLMATLNHQGGTAVAGSEGATDFRGSARLMGTVTNAAGTAAGGSGGRLEFHDSARVDSTGYDGSLGALQILNGGASVIGAGGGRVVFHGDSFARGANLVIVNGAGAESSVVGASGGLTQFLDRSRAGQLTIHNESGFTSSAPGTASPESGQTQFRNAASAENAQVFSSGGRVAGANGGVVQFFDDATAASALVDNGGGRVAGAAGGFASFYDRANAGNATIVNGAGLVNNARGASTLFAGSSGAGRAFISNESMLGGGGGGGLLEFGGSASAQQASIDNRGGLRIGDVGRTQFYDRATAGDAIVVNFGGRAISANGGQTAFSEDASAGRASFVNAGGAAAAAFGGRIQFLDRASAADANISVRAGQASAALGGGVELFADSSAGRARFVVDAARFAQVGTMEGGWVHFLNRSTAADATFTVGGGQVGGAEGGSITFIDQSSAGRAVLTIGAAQADAAKGATVGFFTSATAGSASLVNQGGSFIGTGGSTSFMATSSADHASIVNQGGDGSFGRTDFFASASAGSATIVSTGSAASGNGGTTVFHDSASAGSATIVSRNDEAAFGYGSTVFRDTASAGTATIVAAGGTVSSTSIGGYTVFRGNSTAGSATLIAESGVAVGAGGGFIQFDDGARGGSARVVLEAGRAGGRGGILDISRLGITGSTTIGSLEGGGNVFLGSKLLFVGANARDTTFSGVISDGGLAGGSGGRLWVYGDGSLTLSGANTYSGGTIIGSSVGGPEGKLIVSNTSGSATGSGSVSVQQSGTLAGSGFIAGPVVLHAGGTIAPGDPVTLTLRDSLTWDGGGVIRLVLGADSAGSDHLNVGTLIRGADGLFLFDLVDFGYTPGFTYDLLSFDALVGFGASDFTARGIDGIFSLAAGGLEFTTVALQPVPEPSTYVLFAAGLAGLAATRRRRNRS